MKEITENNKKKNLKDKTACFVIQHELPSEIIQSLQEGVSVYTRILLSKGYRYFGIGANGYFDRCIVDTILKFKKEFPDICLILVLPYRGFTDDWDIDDKLMYDYSMMAIDKVVYTSDKEEAGCEYNRNRHLVDNSSACITYLTKRGGENCDIAEYIKSQEIVRMDLDYYINSKE